MMARVDVTNTHEAVRAATTVAAAFGVRCADPDVLSDGANVVVHLRPAPVVAKVAATTALVRPEVATWLQREVDLTTFLAGQGIPIAGPAADLPATTHSSGGRVMSFWQYVPHDRDRIVDADTAGALLRQLHEALWRCPAALPYLCPLQDVERTLAGTTALDAISAADRAALTHAWQRLSSVLAATDLSVQPLHGDAGVGNLLAGAHGWVWCDLEDVCSGPVAWDLAALTSSRRLDARTVLRGYAEAVDPEQLSVCEELRRLHLTIWYAWYAQRLPRHRARAAELVASWRR